MILDATRLRRAAPWVGATALLVAAWGLGVATPPRNAIEPPVVIHAEMGERATGRNLAAVVNDVRATQFVSTPNWSADGNWLIVDLDAASVLSQREGRIGGATLKIGERTFRASERPGTDSLFAKQLLPGVWQSGSIAFELPEDALSGTGTLSLSQRSDTRGDSLIQLSLDLESVPVTASEELLPLSWTQP